MRRGLSGWLQWFGISSGALWVVVLCGVWWVLCVVVARVPTLQMFPQEQPSRPQYHLPHRPSTACRHRTRPPNTRGSVGSLWCGGFGPRNWVLRGPAHCCWPLVRALLVCGCSGGVLLSRSLVGAVPLALGGLASGFGMGPGVSLPRCGRRDGGGVWCVGLGSPLVGGVGGLVLGCVVDAVGSSGVRVALSSAPSSCSRGRPGVGVVPCWGCSRVLWGGLCVGCVRVGRLVPVG